MKNKKNFRKEIGSILEKVTYIDYFEGQCPICGGKIEVEKNSNIWYCEYCGQVNVEFETEVRLNY